MDDKELYELGRNTVKKEKTIFMAIAIALAVLTLVLGTLFILWCIIVAILPWIVQGEGEPLSLATKITSTIVLVLIFVFGALVVTVPLLAGSIACFVIMFRKNKVLKSEELLILRGKKIELAKQLKLQKAEEKRLKQEALQAEEASIRESIKASKTPDFPVQKEFFAVKAYVWINTDEKLIQFSFASGVLAKNSNGKFLKPREELFNKTKVLKLEDLAKIELAHDSQTISETDLSGVRFTATESSKVGYASGSIINESTTYHYFQVEFTFNDIDCPVVHVYFDNDRQKAESLYQTVNLLTRKE